MAAPAPESLTVPARNARLMRGATAAAVAVALTLAVAKSLAWLVTGSVAVLSSLVDSLIDIAASALNWLAVRQALVPADDDHRFGHGKAEPLAGLGQSAFISGSALLLILQAAQRLWQPQPIAHEAVAIGTMALSLVLTVLLVAFQRSVVRRTGSVAVGADQLHYASDVLHNGAVILALLAATQFHAPWIDPACGIGVALYILWGAAQIARQSLDLLMDRELPDETRARILAIAHAHPEVRDVHDLRTRSTGQHIFVQLHLGLDGAIDLRHAHDVSDAVERELRAAFPNAEILIHQDPAGLARPGAAQG